MLIKSRRIRWEGRVARMKEKGNAYRIFLWETRRKAAALKTLM
jgi:hypothetical protein